MKFVIYDRHIVTVHGCSQAEWPGELRSTLQGAQITHFKRLDQGKLTEEEGSVLLNSFLR